MSMTQVFNFEMQRGDTPVLQAFLRDSDTNALVNDPAATYKLTARASRNADAALFEIGPLPQYAAGEGRLPIPTGATSGFTYHRVIYYEVEAVESNGNATTPLKGRITVWVR